MKAFKRILLFQSLYLIVTGIWPIISIATFIAVTGPKTELWLVKTVGVLALAMGITMFISVYKSKINTTVLLLAITNASAFASIDFYYYLKGVISVVYVYDGILQLLFILAQGYCMWNYRQLLSEKL